MHKGTALQVGHRYIPPTRLGVAEPALDAAPIPADLRGVIPGPAILGVRAADAAFSKSRARSRSLLMKRGCKHSSVLIRPPFPSRGIDTHFSL